MSQKKATNGSDYMQSTTVSKMKAISRNSKAAKISTGRYPYHHPNGNDRSVIVYDVLNAVLKCIARGRRSSGRFCRIVTQTHTREKAHEHTPLSPNEIAVFRMICIRIKTLIAKCQIRLCSNKNYSYCDLDIKCPKRIVMVAVVVVMVVVVGK